MWVLFVCPTTVRQISMNRTRNAPLLQWCGLVIEVMASNSSSICESSSMSKRHDTETYSKVPYCSYQISVQSYGGKDLFYETSFSWNHHELYKLCCYYLIYCWLDPAISNFYFWNLNKADTEIRKILGILEKVTFFCVPSVEFEIEPRPKRSSGAHSLMQIIL